MWVTKLSGTDAWLGVAVEGDDGAAFLCGGADALESHTRWMLTDVTEDEVVFEQGGFVVELALSDGDVSGSVVEPGGGSSSFEARRVGELDLAGVYFGFDAGCGDGLIVLDGANGEPEALGAWCDESGFREQVIPVLPIERQGDGVAAFVELMDDRRDFVMTRVDPGAVTP
jgi:hypothetical protein